MSNHIRRLHLVAAALPAPDAAADTAEQRRIGRRFVIERLAGEIAAQRHQRDTGWGDGMPVACGTLTDLRWWSWPGHGHWPERPGRPLGAVMLHTESDPTFLDLRDRERDRLETLRRDLGADAGMGEWLREADTRPPSQGCRTTFGEDARRSLAGEDIRSFYSRPPGVGAAPERLR